MRGGRTPAAPDHDHRRVRRGVPVALDISAPFKRTGVEGEPPRPEQQPAVPKHIAYRTDRQNPFDATDHRPSRDIQLNDHVRI